MLLFFPYHSIRQLFASQIGEFTLGLLFLTGRVSAGCGVGDPARRNCRLQHRPCMWRHRKKGGPE